VGAGKIRKGSGNLLYLHPSGTLTNHAFTTVQARFTARFAAIQTLHNKVDK